MRIHLQPATTLAPVTRRQPWQHTQPSALGPLGGTSGADGGVPHGANLMKHSIPGLAPVAIVRARSSGRSSSLRQKPPRGPPPPVGNRRVAHHHPWETATWPTTTRGKPPRGPPPPVEIRLWLGCVCSFSRHFHSFLLISTHFYSFLLISTHFYSLVSTFYSTCTAFSLDFRPTQFLTRCW